jgi:tetratricopeptide (TPR) repeat protein
MERSVRPRRHRLLRALLLSLLVGLALCAPGAALAQQEPASGSELWYVLRGRANMQIGNYRAAVEAWQKAVELNPENREAMKQLGFAYEKQGLTAKAIEQFDRYLERFRDDPDVAFKQAEYLGWERYAYRRDDAIRYYEMGLAQREDLARRHALARLLAQERSQLGPALEQYEILLAARPDDAEWRSEYRELLLWDEDRLDDAIREFRRLERERPGDFAVERRLAELIARQAPRSDEAVSRSAALVAKHPSDVSLRLAYAELLSADPDRRELAIEEYRTLLSQQPSASHREALADLLSGRADGRREALDLYRALLRAEPGLARVRVKRARLLSSERRDVEAAIREYEIVVKQQPDNAEAHAGLAECYAWTGDLDTALHHSNLAVRHGGRGRDLAEVRQTLLRGREPRLGPFVDVLVQGGRSKTKLHSVGFGLSGSADLSPFFSLRGRTGFAEYWRGSDDEATGFLDVDAEYRFDPANAVELGLGYHSLPHRGRNLLVRASYARRGETWTLRGGFERKLRFDSYVALVGEEDGSDEIGSARENRFYGVASAERGRFEAEIEPYAGFVDAKSSEDNAFVGFRGRLAWRLLEIRSFDLTPFYESDLYHYEEDAFGVSADADAEPGGYFSPPFFFEQVPGLALAFRLGKDSFLDLEGGPALQVVDEAGESSRFEVGGRAGLSYVTFLRESLYWTLESEFLRIGEVYTRVAVTTSLTFKF